MSNSISFVGRLGKDSVLKTVGQSSVCEFSTAHEVGYGERKQTIWTKNSLWGKQGEALAQYLVKSKQVWISGELSLREYTDKEGKNRISAEVRVSAIDLVGGRQDGQQDAPAQAPRQQAGTQQAAPEGQDLPF